MRVMRYPMAVAMAAILAGTAHGQTAPTRPAAPASTPSPPSGQPAAGALNPAAEAAPAPAATAPQFDLADGIVASVNDRIITGYDLRQRMLMLILSSEIQPTQENLPAIQQAALNALIEERLKAQEITNYESLRVSDEEVSAEIAEMARRAGLTPDAYLAQLSQAGIQPQAFRENLRTERGC